ncbi:replication-associated recombination protein A [Miltoncostaea marina]|uniref:replication-associated recombination protein A n=1 Tax=Miltoncostaea marina TaxID=2843215 RepID=UPI001C3E2CBF|nr:replication-associated recombination protein A [Miltoncostaea marina]
MARRGGGPPQGDLFGEAVESRLQRSRPLAARMRPERIDEVVGQEALLGPGGALREAIVADRVPSMILYGPPGSGKTTLARVVAHSTSAAFEELSAVSATVADVRATMARARDRLAAGTRTVLFLDEIHRFNRAQQDALLPAVEDGLVTLIGATTQNPWYEVNAALVSRMRVWVLEPLGPRDVGRLLDRAAADERGLAGRVRLTPEARDAIVARAGGDARGALNLLEAAAAGTTDGAAISLDAVRAASGGRAVVYDRAGDAHYDTISAFIKSLRASDPDAAIYYLAVMLSGGEDPKFIARRLIVAASEDVGNADPRALQVAVAAGRAVEFVGLPEARISLAQATTYIALAPKSNAAYRAIDAALAEVEREGARRPPLALRDASVANARGLGHGAGYVYPHDHPDAVVEGSLMPEGLEDRVFYEPTDRGAEGELSARLRAIRARLREDDQPF